MKISVPTIVVVVILGIQNYCAHGVWELNLRNLIPEIVLLLNIHLKHLFPQQEVYLLVVQLTEYKWFSFEQYWFEDLFNDSILMV